MYRSNSFVSTSHGKYNTELKSVLIISLGLRVTAQCRVYSDIYYSHLDSIRYRLFDCTIRGGVDLGKLHGNAIGNSFTLYYIKYIFNIDEYRGSEPGEEGEREFKLLS